MDKYVWYEILDNIPDIKTISEISLLSKWNYKVIYEYVLMKLIKGLFCMIDGIIYNMQIRKLASDISVIVFAISFDYNHIMNGMGGLCYST